VGIGSSGQRVSGKDELEDFCSKSGEKEGGMYALAVKMCKSICGVENCPLMLVICEECGKIVSC